jgi:hypothetical protein
VRGPIWIRQSARLRKIALAMIGCVTLAGSAALGIGGGTATAQAARPGPHANTGARPVLGPAARHAPPVGSQGQPCFDVFPNCTSGDPAVAFTMNSDHDTTGCNFQQDTEWGDGSHTTLTYNGGSDGSTLVTFQHTYSTPGVYQISSTIVVQVQNASKSCSGSTFSLQFTLPVPPDVSCQAAQTSIPAVKVPVHVPKNPVQVSYGPMPLNFPAGTTAGNSLCTMRSGPTVMPVDLNVPHAAAIKIAGIDSTDTIEFHEASNAALGVPNCDFAALQALAGTDVTPPVSDFTGTNNCLLTPTFHQSWDVVAKWTSPGITVTTHSAAAGHQLTLYSTGPATYYVDLDTLPNFPGSGATFSQTMQAVESYIRTTLLQNIPVIDKIALFQADHDRSQVTDPLGRLVGVGSDSKVTRSFPGAGYANVGGRSVAWILEPVPGTYHVTVRGKAKSKSQADFTVVQLLGHGDNPIIKTISWKALPGGGGTATSKFTEAGQAIAPVPQAHESRTRAKKGQQVTFNLHHSVIAFIPAKVTWSFGDGTKVATSPAAHSYKRAGHFVPEATITNSLGYSVTVALHEIVVTG